MILIEETNEDIIENKEEKQPFKITDLSSADWCFKNLKRLKEKQKEINDYVNLEKTKIENYRINETNKIKSDKEYFEGLLRAYVEEQEENDPKFKLSTVNGMASFGKVQQKINYDDNVMLDFCKQNKLDNLITVTTTEKLNKKELNSYLSIIDGKVVTEDGEVLENILIEEKRNFNIKIK